MRYVIPILSVIFVIGGFTALLIKGGAPERRYEHSACQYRMIYQYTPEEPMGLVTLGGSRMRVATSADHCDDCDRWADTADGFRPVDHRMGSCDGIDPAAEYGGLGCGI